MYESPIEKIYQDIQNQIIQRDEQMFFSAIQKCNIKVNKEELIKALKYDRNQYTKGYNDGKSEILNKIRAEIRDTGAYEQETHGKTEFLEGINYCLDVIDKIETKS